MTRIAVYAICHNEERHVRRFLDSCEGADAIVVCDTGSTDATVALLAERATLHSIRVQPWRFDDARNAALALVPTDIDWCVALDLDETLTPGWRARLERCMNEHPRANQIRVPYLWSRQPRFMFHWEKAHARGGWRWKNACHEALVRSHGDASQPVWLDGDPLIEHDPDSSKPRSDYLQLLEVAVREDPGDARAAFYLHRERAFRDMAERGETCAAWLKLASRAHRDGFEMETRFALTRAAAAAVTEQESALARAQAEALG